MLFMLAISKNFRCFEPVFLVSNEINVVLLAVSYYTVDFVCDILACFGADCVVKHFHIIDGHGELLIFWFSSLSICQWLADWVTLLSWAMCEEIAISYCLLCRSPLSQVRLQWDTSPHAHYSSEFVFPRTPFQVLALLFPQAPFNR